MTKEEIIEKLRDDESYYGDFGKQFLSNSDLGTLIKEPWNFRKEEKGHSSALTIGSYFHMCILEEHKLDMFEIKESSRSIAKPWVIAQKDVDMCHRVRDKILGNESLHELIRGKEEGDVEYEVPGLVELEGETFKGKADILNHKRKLIVDLKSTSSIDRFPKSAYSYGYNSQSYIYSQMFGYDMVFVVADKNDLRLGYYTTSDKFVEYGKGRMLKGLENYKLYKEGYDFSQYVLEREL